MSAQKFTIAEAHRATGKSESTIRLHLKDRKNPLSYQKDESGKVLIDGAELLRRYPDSVTLESLESAKLKKNGAGQGALPAPKNEALEMQLLKKDLEHIQERKKQLENDVEHFKELYQEARSDKKDINKFIGLIEDMSKQKANESSLKDEKINRLQDEVFKLKNALKAERRQNEENNKGFFEKLLKG